MQAPHHFGAQWPPSSRADAARRGSVQDGVRFRRSPAMPIARLAEEGRLSGAVVHSGLVWLAGQVADDASLDVEGQTADILGQIDALLAEAGTDKRHLLSVTVVLADIAEAPAMNRAWDRWLDPKAKPARMTIEARLVDPAWRVEITGVAALPDRHG
jgi:enamine deaminase RidA (YjgF/YER057c/UK114 family)